MVLMADHARDCHRRGAMTLRRARSAGAPAGEEALAALVANHCVRDKHIADLF